MPSGDTFSLERDEKLTLHMENDVNHEKGDGFFMYENKLVKCYCSGDPIGPWDQYKECKADMDSSFFFSFLFFIFFFFSFLFRPGL